MKSHYYNTSTTPRPTKTKTMADPAVQKHSLKLKMPGQPKTDNIPNLSEILKKKSKMSDNNKFFSDQKPKAKHNFNNTNQDASPHGQSTQVTPQREPKQVSPVGSRSRSALSRSRERSATPVGGQKQQVVYATPRITQGIAALKPVLGAGQDIATDGRNRSGMRAEASLKRFKKSTSITPRMINREKKKMQKEVTDTEKKQLIKKTQDDISNMFQNCMKKNKNKFKDYLHANQSRTIALKQQNSSNKTSLSKTLNQRKSGTKLKNILKDESIPKDIYVTAHGGHTNSTMMLNNFCEATTQKSNIASKKSMMNTMKFSNMTLDVSCKDGMAQSIHAKSNKTGGGLNKINERERSSKRQSIFQTFNSGSRPKSVGNFRKQKQTKGKLADPKLQHISKQFSRRSSSNNFISAWEDETDNNNEGIVVDDFLKQFQSTMDVRYSKRNETVYSKDNKTMNPRENRKSSRIDRSRSRLSNNGKASKASDDNQQEEKKEFKKSMPRKTQIQKKPLTQYMKNLTKAANINELKTNLNFALTHTRPSMPITPDKKKTKNAIILEKSPIQKDNKCFKDKQETEDHKSDNNRKSDASSKKIVFSKKILSMGQHQFSSNLFSNHENNMLVEGIRDEILRKSEVLPCTSNQTSDAGLLSDCCQYKNDTFWKNPISLQIDSQSELKNSTWSRQSLQTLPRKVDFQSEQKLKEADDEVEIFSQAKPEILSEQQKKEVYSENNKQIDTVSVYKKSEQDTLENQLQLDLNCDHEVSMKDCQLPEITEQQISLQSLQSQILQTGETIFPDQDKRQMIETMLKQIMTQQAQITKFQETVKQQKSIQEKKQKLHLDLDQVPPYSEPKQREEDQQQDQEPQSEDQDTVVIVAVEGTGTNIDIIKESAKDEESSSRYNETDQDAN